ncbi:MAG: hypothetical protein Q8T08_23635, partial [Ignavibacteria bacterium]|nr:hypothetical protein [Ignavibacteria bacterium]
MSKVKNFIQRYIVPQGILDIRRNYIRKTNITKLRFPENLKLKNLEINQKRCFILATGPSIKKMDLSPLKGELCVSVSNFFVHHQFDDLKPAYHVLAPSHPPITSSDYKSFLEDAFNHMKHPISIFMGDSDKHIVETMKIPSNV